MNSNSTLETEPLPALARPGESVEGELQKGGASLRKRRPGRGRGRARRGRRRNARRRPDAQAGGAAWYHVLSASEERALAERNKDGDPIARQQLILAHLKLVRSIVGQYKSSELSYDDLVQEGNLGLIRAARDFDPATHRTRFSTYAKFWIRGFIVRALATNSSVIKVPEYQLNLRARQRRALAGDGGQGESAMGTLRSAQPGLGEVAGPVGGSPRQQELMRRMKMECSSDLADEEDEELIVLRAAVPECDLPERILEKGELRSLVQAAMRHLSPVERWVIRERYGLGATSPDRGELRAPSSQAGGLATPTPGPPSPGAAPAGMRRRSQAYYHQNYRQIGRACRLSVKRIRQVEKTALGKLREFLRASLAPTT
jgi:RNA polymerase primary sigma factor